MGGRVNVWQGGRNSSGIVDKNGNPISRGVFKDHVTYNDGKLEFATFSTLLHVILAKSKRVAQSSGPFEFKFHENRNFVTYINIDGEFYQANNIRKITLHKYFQKHPLRILVNERNNIFD